MRGRKTWAEKMRTPEPHTTVLDRSWAGLPPGATMLISSPREIEALVSRIPVGRTRSVPELREALARRHRADTTCPLTTGIFLRIVSEHAWDALEAGAAIDAIAPFWRVVEPGSPLAGKLRAGSGWIARQREAEGIEVAAKRTRPHAARASRARTGR